MKRNSIWFIIKMKLSDLTVQTYSYQNRGNLILLTIFIFGVQELNGFYFEKKGDKIHVKNVRVMNFFTRRFLPPVPIGRGKEGGGEGKGREEMNGLS